MIRRTTLLAAFAIAFTGCDTGIAPKPDPATALAARFAASAPPMAVQRARIAVFVDGSLRDTLDLAYRRGTELSLGTVPFGSTFEIALVGYDSGAAGLAARWAARTSGRAESATGTQWVDFVLQVPPRPEVAATGTSSTDTLLLSDSLWAADDRDPSRASPRARYRVGDRSPVPLSGRIVFARSEPSGAIPAGLRDRWTDFDTLWSDTVSLTFTDPTGGVLADRIVDRRDGRSYRTLSWLGRTWMAENLAWEGATGATGLCPERSADSCARYGRLYTWKEAMAAAPRSAASPSGVTGICPEGWHLPSLAEWNDLANLLGGRPVAGDSLRLPEAWRTATAGRDAIGFGALPAGQGYAADSTFSGRGTDAFWWSTDATSSSSEATRLWLTSSSPALFESPGYTSGPFTQMAAVRCVKN